MLDTRIQVQTPEGIELSLTPAGLLPRSVAWVLDFFIRLIVWWVGYLLFVWIFGEVGFALFFLVSFALYWLYNVVFEVVFNGQTPGKKLLGLRVMRTNGSPVRLTASVLRNLLRVVDFLPFAYLLGIGSMMFSPRFKRLGDIVADTVVAYDAPLSSTRPLEFDREERLPLALKAADHRAVLLYAERLDTLTDERAVELAGQLSDVMEGSPADIRDRLRAHARWLNGAQS
ncbi:MAG: RDD family protein [Pseudomonadota bacterium]